MAREYAIELKKITKTFGAVLANNQIDMSVRKGEILALLGENGSGKTTLMNMLSGIYRPDSGSIFIYGKEVSIRSPKDSFAMGIGMIHQHFKLVEVFSAKENIILGTKKHMRAGKDKLSEEIKKVSRRFGLEIDPDKRVYDMSVSEKQTVEILKALYKGTDILILDEPTAVLTPQETAKLFDILRKMKEEGCAVVIITHKLNEVLEISDRVTILRKGESVATVETKETSAKELTELMVGRSVDLSIQRPKVTSEENLLAVKGLHVKTSEGLYALKDVSFSLRKGEVLGVAGMAGSGQKELCEAVVGLEEIESGQVIYKEEDIVGKTPREIIKKGISMSFIPEDRLGMGLVAGMNIVDNLILKSYSQTKGPFVDRKSPKVLAKKLIEKLGIVIPGMDTPVRQLSGGNVQKVLLGREIDSEPHLLITAYPVRGLDINSSYKIYDLINEQKEKGVGVIYIGEDLDVILELCDRVMVLCQGQVSGIVNACDATKEDSGLLMAGVSGEKEGAAHGTTEN